MTPTFNKENISVDYQSGMSQSQIGRKYGKKQATVCMAMRRFGIPARKWEKGEFWGRCVKDDKDCLLWTDAQDGNGYGAVRFRGRTTKAYRVAWILTYGEIPVGMEVCHSCDIPACINPAHLFLGTHLDNCRDRDSKGRVASGARHYRARFTVEQIAEIRSLHQTGSRVGKLAVQFNVAQSMISRIVSGKTYAINEAYAGDPEF